MKQRIFSLFTALCLCLTLLPTAAFAEGDEGGATETTGVDYLYYDEESKTMKTGTKSEGEYITVTSSTDGASWSGWYVVKDKDVKIDGTVTLTGDTHLILCDGADLTVTGGIINNYSSNDESLTIYGQSAGGGKLTANTTSSPTYWLAATSIKVPLTQRRARKRAIIIK